MEGHLIPQSPTIMNYFTQGWIPDKRATAKSFRAWCGSIYRLRCTI